MKGSSNMASPSHRLRGLFSVCMIVCGVSCTQRTPPVAAQASLKQSQAAQQRTFWLNQFEPFGFRPLSEATAESREIRRAVFLPPWGYYRIPGIELERELNGQVVLRFVTPEGVNSLNASTDVWQRLADIEEEAFRPIRPTSVVRESSETPSPPTPPPPPPPPCHGWGIFTAATGARGERVAGGSDCNPGTAQIRYAAEIAKIALRTRPDCGIDETDPFASFDACFAIRAPTETPSPKR